MIHDRSALYVYIIFSIRKHPISAALQRHCDDARALVDEALQSFRRRELGIVDVTSPVRPKAESEAGPSIPDFESTICDDDVIDISLQDSIEVAQAVVVDDDDDNFDPESVLRAGNDVTNGDFALMSARLYQDIARYRIDGHTIELSEKEGRQVEV